MSKQISAVKKMLNTAMNQLCKLPDLCAKNPRKDFTRNRKLPFKDVLYTLLSLSGNTLRNELIQHFKYDKCAPSASAFVQQRKKIHPNALPTLFRFFVKQNKSTHLYKGLRLMAVDGSSIHIPLNTSDKSSYFTSAMGEYNLLHLSAMYNLLDRTYVDAHLVGNRDADERMSLCNMVDRAEGAESLIIADRGYEGFNVMAHIQNKGWKYLIRVQDITTKSGICGGLDLPKGEFDEFIDLSLTKSNSKETRKLAKNKNAVRILKSGYKHDFIPNNSSKKGPAIFYRLPFRVVRFKLTDESYEVIVTNLDPQKFPATELKRIYHMRWGIETSFRELKYTVGLTHFHAKKVEYTYQEIFARLITYNFTQLIVATVNIPKTNKKYVYKPNFSVAVNVCRQFILGVVSPPKVEATILQNVSPIRPGRSFQRNIADRKSVSFNYRIA